MIKRSKEEELLDQELADTYLKDISEDMPNDLAMLARLKAKFPSLLTQIEDCEKLCNEIILEKKNLYRKLKQQE